MRFVYNLIICLITPYFFLQLLLRSVKVPAHRRRWNERLAIYRSKALKVGVIWLHAVSFGEAESVFPLMRALKGLYPDIPQLVTTTTSSGSERVRFLFGNTIEHVYLPYDLPGSASRFLHHFSPILGIVVETEIWPNLYRACARAHVPLVIINARLSERSIRGYRKIPGLVRGTLGHVSLIAAQSFDDAERFVNIGADREKVFMTGNIKFDYLITDTVVETGHALRKTLFGNRPVWIAASTHKGEEEQILYALEFLKIKHPDLLLVLAPRQPERFGEVNLLCKTKGFEVVLRSSGLPCTASANIFLVDTLGELKQFYAASDVAFVGGSLVQAGGHNALEAAAIGVPVLFGPNMFNFVKIAELLAKGGGAIQVTDRSTLIKEADKLLADDKYRRAMGNSGRRVVEENRGAVQRTLDLLGSYLERNQERIDDTRMVYRKSA